MSTNTIPATMIAAVHALIRLPEVKRRCALSRSEIYRRVGLGTFPAPIKIGQHASAWADHEISEWIADRIADRDAKERAA